MSIEQFNKTAFTKGMKLKHKDVEYLIGFVDFEQQLFGLLDCQEGIRWVRCENIELVNKN